MLSAYFDTTVYDHIVKGYIPGAEVDALRAERARRDLVVHLSVADVEELIGQWDTDRAAAVSRLALARDLAGFDGLLKPPDQLMEEAIRAFATATAPPASTVPRHDRRLYATQLRLAARGDRRVARELSEIVADVKARKERFREAMTDARERTLAELKWESRTADERRALTFERFWARGATSWAEAFADRIGLAAECRERGLDRLLEVRAVRLGVGAAMSLTFSLVVEGREAQRGDGYDQLHAVMASVTDVFMTRDDRLAGHLRRVPVDGFRVVTSLPEPLDDFQAARSS